MELRWRALPAGSAIMLEQEINLVQISHPSKATFKFSPPRARCIVKYPGYARGEDVEASI